MLPRETIAQFDEFLHQRGLVFEAVVLGGAALGLMGIVSRPTRDCDVLHPALPEAIRVAAQAFAIERRKLGHELDDDWLNDGPASLARSLPADWLDRVQEVFQGRAIVLKAPGRIELIMSKVFALCDRAVDLQDCIALAPTGPELDDILPWLEQQDANPDWPAHVRDVVGNLRQRLGRGI